MENKRGSGRLRWNKTLYSEEYLKKKPRLSTPKFAEEMHELYRKFVNPETVRRITRYKGHHE